MTEEQTYYVKNRVENQITWFDKKSSINKCHHYWLASISVAGAIFSASSLLVDCATASAVLSLLVALSIAIDNFFHFREKWLTYRLACENLRSLLFRFNALGAKDWDAFVCDVETIIAQANENWQNQIEKIEK